MWGTLTYWRQGLAFFGSLLIAVGIALAAHYLLIRVVRSLARRMASGVDELLIRHLRQPLRWLMIVLAVYLAYEPFQLPGGFDEFTRQVLSIASILLVTWLLIGATFALSDIILLRFQMEVKDDTRARGIRTQVNVLRRVILAAIVTVGAASTNILGTVLLYADYTLPVDAVRAELQRILERTSLWDRQVGLLQVTNASERAVELRVLVSASDSGASWDLRCYIREQLIDFIQKQYPHALPKLRAELPQSESRMPHS